jgi:hypothetical protein
MRTGATVTRILHITGRRLLLRIASLCRCKVGNAAIEFALVLPILMILLAGTLDYAAYVNSLMNLNAAARGGAEWAKVNFPTGSTSVTCPSNGTICQYGNFPSGVSVTYAPVCTCVDNSTAGGSCPSAPTCTGSDPRVIEYVQVNATQSFSSAVPYTSLLLPTSLSASAALRVQ